MMFRMLVEFDRNSSSVDADVAAAVSDEVGIRHHRRLRRCRQVLPGDVAVADEAPQPPTQPLEIARLSM